MTKTSARISFICRISKMCLLLLATLCAIQSAELEKWDGSIYVGEVQFKNGVFNVKQSSDAQSARIDDTFEIRFNDEAKDTSNYQRLNLTDGSKINGEIGVSSNFNQVPVDLASGKSVRIAGDLIQSIEFQPLDPGAKVVGNPPSAYCISRNGKTILCDIEWISNNDISMSTKAGRLKLQRDKIHMIGFARPQTAPVEKADICLHTRFNDSLLGKLISIDDDTVQIEHILGRLSFKRADILSIETLSQHVQQLSKLKPSSVEQTPYLDYIKDMQIDANLFGGPLVLDGTRFDSGIAMHSRTAATYNLGSAYQRFVTSIGIDRTVTDLGNVDFVILADGREVKRVNQTGKMHNQLIHIDTKDVKTLSIMVDFAKNGSSGDHAIWGDPRLIK